MKNAMRDGKPRRHHVGCKCAGCRRPCRCSRCLKKMRVQQLTRLEEFVAQNLKHLIGNICYYDCPRCDMPLVRIDYLSSGFPGSMRMSCSCGE